MKSFEKILLSIGIFLFGIKTAFAVPPPDFLFNIGAQIAQFFSVAMLLGVALLTTIRQFSKTYFLRMRNRGLAWTIIVLVVLGLVALSTYLYSQYEQNASYQNWLGESKTQNLSIPTAFENSFQIPPSPSPSPSANLLLIKTASGSTAERLSFFDQNKDVPLSIGNEDFKQLTSSNSVFVLDAREDEEYAIGNFPKSDHIRFADLIAGKWEDLPKDQIVYIFCWSGIRGKEVAEFLRSKNIVARYIEKGADGWVSFGGKWDGGVIFSAVYPQERYKKLFTLDELKKEIKKGVTIVDSRQKEKYAYWHIPGSINIPIIYTQSDKLDALLDQVLKNASVITVCDDFVSCFDAKITGLKLEKKNHKFLGRYNKPWEYRASQ